MQGQSWSIGMDKDAQTVANFLKFYNPSIIGGSLGSHIGEVSHTEDKLKITYLMRIEYVSVYGN